MDGRTGADRAADLTGHMAEESIEPPRTTCGEAYLFNKTWRRGYRIPETD